MVLAYRSLKMVAQLAEYIRHFPAAKTAVAQKLADFDAEAGVFYQRAPGAKRGSITSLTLKYRPYVTGDGKQSIQALIESDERASRLKALYLEKNKHRLSYVPKTGELVTLAFAGSHCRGSIFRDGKGYITPDMTRALDRIAQSMPDFHYGRFDIKFKSLSDFMCGVNFQVIEINGASSEPTHIWDSRTPLKVVFSTLFNQYHTLFEMGSQIREAGKTPPSAMVMIKTWIRELKQGKTHPKAVTEI